MPGNDWLHCRCYKRRTILELALVALLAGSARAAEEGEAAKPPAPDDRFVFLTGPKKGQVVRAEDLALGGPQVQAYPMAPDGTVRSDSRLNLVILARFDPAALTDETRTRAADGVVTYSAICTHQACPVNMWKERQHVRLLLPRLHLRSQKRRRGDRWAGSASACCARAEAQGRRRIDRFDLFGSRRRHAELIRASHCDRPDAVSRITRFISAIPSSMCLRRELKVDGICSSLKVLAIASWTNSLDPAAEIGQYAGVGRAGTRQSASAVCVRGRAR
jgi:rieske iron-sulfur protein